MTAAFNGVSIEVVDDSDPRIRASSSVILYLTVNQYEALERALHPRNRMTDKVLDVVAEH